MKPYAAMLGSRSGWVVVDRRTSRVVAAEGSRAEAEAHAERLNATLKQGEGTQG